MGLRSLAPEREEFVRGSQLRAVDGMAAVRTTVAMVSIIFAGLTSMRHVPDWMIAIWIVLAVGARVPILRLERRNRRTGYRGVTRGTILYHGALSAMLGVIWSLPALLLAFADAFSAVEMVALWTLTSCLMTAIAVAFHSAPLASASFVLPVGAASILMISRQSDPLLTAVVATYTLLLFVTSLRQAHQFGEQLSTSNELAEKQEVVSLLLKEHEVEGADWLWQTDTDGRLKDVSPALCRMLGMERAALEGQRLLHALPPTGGEGGRREAARQALADRLAARAAFSEIVLAVLVQGEQRWWELSASPRRDEHGTFLGFRGVASDITARKESAERIAQLARHDILTDLPNRLSLTEELTSALDGMERWNQSCGVMMIDLDRFKAVNDTLGHQIGDDLLVQVAARLRAVCSPKETVARLGGDEFAVVLHDLPNAAHVERLAGAIIDRVSEPYMVDNHALHIGASIGSAIAPQDGRSVSALMRGADLAMYRAKDAGGGRHCAFEPAMQADIEERRMLEAALREALAANQLHLAYQPILDVATGAITGFEALARWTHPVLGPVPPTRFIPLAEEARLIGPIGDWVLRNACVEAMRWPEAVTVSINVSPEQLRDPAFLETVVSALAHSGLAAERLVLDVTETVFMRERTGAMQLLDKLMTLGVGLALDDFGTGRSSIGYFSRTRFGAIKIDRAFVAGAARGQRESLAIVRAAVAMAQAMEIDSVAEGVESMAEYERMCALGFTRVQGFHLGRPMPASDACALVRQRGSAVA